MTIGIVPSMETRYEDLVGVPCRVIDTEDGGRPVVFVHGLGGNAENWSLVMGPISETRRCLALDLPGFGMSSPARTHDIDTHVAAVVSLARTLGEPVTLVGNSMGGLVSARVASEHPDVVGGLVLISPASPLPRIDDIADRTVTARLLTQAIPGVGELVLRSLQQRLSPQQQADYTLELVAHRFEDIPPRVRDRAIAIAELRRGMPWAIRAFSESARSTGLHIVARTRFAATIRSIRQPTTLIWGTEDRLVSPASMEWLATQRPDWRTIRMQMVGHVPMIEVPEVVIEAVASQPAPAS